LKKKGLIGLALSYILSVTGLLNGLITTFTETEKEMISVERTHQFKNLDKENLKGSIRVNENWPIQGNIQFIDVCLRYSDGSKYALDDVNLSIIGGEKIGIVGRTGSGKSSLFTSLFRLVELNSGVILIDGIPIRNLDLLRLRRAMSIITQDPFLFNSSLRDNIDPYETYTNDEIRQVLDKCRLNALSLDLAVEENGKNLSCGQRQLICLARALLTNAKILCIDEATASIDYETDNYIQEILRTQFQSVTILTIAHRINTILDYDKVIVMNNGKLIEFDTINNLLNSKYSYFKQLVDSEFQSFKKNKKQDETYWKV
jgi:ATP-binding cassette subfamily C (CFTR/MRP) protein 10